MERKLYWLRSAFWVAAVVDFAIAALMLVPERMTLETYAYPMGLAAAIAFSWGVLLVVADRRPRERRWVIPPTMLVVALLGGVAAHAGATGLIPVARAAATGALATTVLLVLGLGYWTSRPAT